MERKRINTALGDIEKVFIVAIGNYYKAHFAYYENAINFCELAISGGADPAEIKINIIFYKKGEDEDVAED